jgi:glucose/arabinose dehydrogenase
MKKIIRLSILMLVIFSSISTSVIAIHSDSQIYYEKNIFNEKNNMNLQDINADLEIVVEGLNSPLVLTHAGDGTNRIFIGDQTGIVYIIQNDILLKDPFLDISNKIVELNSVYDERGFLGMTFHPNFENNKKFYVYYSAPKSGQGIDHESILAEFTVSEENPNIVDPISEKIIFKVDQPESNHNGGQIEFGPDGFLYIGLGDGGGAGDVHGTIGNGQDINTLLGAILRIDVDGGFPYAIPSDNPFVGVEGLDEIYAFGFRNPWKFSFDNETGRLFVADVGQDLWEEVNIVLKGRNYGWRIMEGTHFYDKELLDLLGLTIDDLQIPVHEYNHDIGKSITGGYVYRKNPNSKLYGKYIFGDWSSEFVPASGKLYYLEENESNNWVRYNLLVKNSNNINRYILSFGKDELGNIYILSKTTLGPTGETGDIRRIILDNQQPTKPMITGPNKGTINKEYEYKFFSSDPDGEKLYYYIEWGDGAFEEWIGPYDSGEEVKVKHTYQKNGFYIIKAKSKDINNIQSQWGHYVTRMPKELMIKNNSFLRLLERIFCLIYDSNINVL